MPIFKAVTRREPLKRGSFLIFLGALAFSLALSGLMLAWQGKPALRGIYLLWDGAFAHGWALEDTLLKSIPIFLASLGVAVCFRMQIWNIGAEGQFALGAVGATWPALLWPQAPAWLLMPAMLLGAAVAGGLWALIPAVLRLKLRVNEIISTLMLNYIGILYLDYLVYGPWKDPVSFGFPMTPEFGPGAVVGTMFGTRIHWGLALCVVVAAVLAVFLHRTRPGYELKASGEGPRTAQYARIPYGALVILVMVMCGVLAGWAGGLEASATLNRLQPSIMAGYGYTAIVVAWLARLRITSIAFFSFVLAGLRVGVENLQLELQVPAAFGGIMEGSILLSVLAGQFFQYYRLRRAAPPAPPRQEEAA
jgi:simple sugar transport system permease protein